MNSGSTTFLKITNKDIFKKIENIEEAINKYNSKNDRTHERLFGRTRLNRWIAGTSLSIALMILGWYLLSGGV